MVKIRRKSGQPPTTTIVTMRYNLDFPIDEDEFEIPVEYLATVLDMGAFEVIHEVDEETFVVIKNNEIERTG